MKKVQILFFLVLTCFIADAQILKGSRVVGGLINFSKNNYQNTSSTELSNYAALGASIGKAYKDNNVWGLNLSYSNTFSRFTYTNSPNVTSRTRKPGYSIGIFNRSYKKITNKVFMFLQPQFGANFYSEKVKNVSSDYTFYKSRNIGIDLTPGLAFPLNTKFLLELNVLSVASLAYHSTETRDPLNSSRNTKNTSFGFSSNLNNLTNLGSFGLGVRVIL